MLANAENIKIFDINGELSDKELSSFIDLVPFKLNIKPTEKKSRQIINPCETVCMIAELRPIWLFIAKARNI